MKKALAVLDGDGTPDEIEAGSQLVALATAGGLPADVMTRQTLLAGWRGAALRALPPILMMAAVVFSARPSAYRHLLQAYVFFLWPLAEVFAAWRAVRLWAGRSAPADLGYLLLATSHAAVAGTIAGLLAVGLAAGVLSLAFPVRGHLEGLVVMAGFAVGFTAFGNRVAAALVERDLEGLPVRAVPEAGELGDIPWAARVGGFGRLLFPAAVLGFAAAYLPGLLEPFLTPPSWLVGRTWRLWSMFSVTCGAGAAIYLTRGALYRGLHRHTLRELAARRARLDAGASALAPRPHEELRKALRGPAALGALAAAGGAAALVAGTAPASPGAVVVAVALGGALPAALGRPGLPARRLAAALGGAALAPVVLALAVQLPEWFFGAVRATPALRALPLEGFAVAALLLTWERLGAGWALAVRRLGGERPRALAPGEVLPIATGLGFLAPALMIFATTLAKVGWPLRSTLIDGSVAAGVAIGAAVAAAMHLRGPVAGGPESPAAVTPSDRAALPGGDGADRPARPDRDETDRPARPDGS